MDQGNTTTSLRQANGTCANTANINAASSTLGSLCINLLRTLPLDAHTAKGSLVSKAGPQQQNSPVVQATRQRLFSKRNGTFCTSVDSTNTQIQPREVLSSCETPGYLLLRQHPQHQCCQQHTRLPVHQLTPDVVTGRSYSQRKLRHQSRAASRPSNMATSLQQAEWNFLYFCIFNEHSDIAKGSVVILRDTRLPAAASTPPTSMLSAAHQQPEHQLETVQDS